MISKISKQKFGRFFSLEPNCPFHYVAAKLSAAKFSYLGAKLSVCLLGVKLSVFTILVLNCLVPNCRGAKFSGAKLSNHPLFF